MIVDSISIPVTPERAPRMTARDKWTNVEKGKGRPTVLRYFKYRDDLRRELPGYRLPAQLYLTFFLPMPPSWSKRRRSEMLGAPHDQTPDIDNLVKAFMDAFNKDEHGNKMSDAHVYYITAEKYWAEEGSIELGDAR